MSIRFSVARLRVLQLSLLVALAPFVLLMAFNHPFFDDFRGAYWTWEHGMWGMQKWFYLTWSGRFTSTFFTSALNPVTYGWLEGVRLVSLVVFALLWASIAYFLRTVFHTVLQSACSRSTAGWTAGLLLALFCNAAPSPFSFLYWFSGVVGYQLTVLSLFAFTALALRTGWGPANRRWRNAAWACMPLVLATAGSELTMVQAAIVLTVLGAGWPKGDRAPWWLWVTVAAAVVVITLAAPGNWLRLSATEPSDPLHAYRWLVLGPRTAYSLAIFVAQPSIALSLLAAAAIGFWLGKRHQGEIQPLLQLSKRSWWVLSMGFVMLNAVGFLLFRYILVGPPLRRAQNEILLLMMVSGAALAWAVTRQCTAPGQWGRHFGTGFLLLVLGLFSTGHAFEAWRELWTSARAFDIQMQARYATLRAAHRAGLPAVTLPPLRLPYTAVLAPLRQFNPGLEYDIDLTAGCEGNINGVMERYFEVPDVCCRPNAPALVSKK